MKKAGPVSTAVVHLSIEANCRKESCKFAVLYAPSRFRGRSRRNASGLSWPSCSRFSMERRNSAVDFLKNRRMPWEKCTDCTGDTLW